MNDDKPNWTITSSTKEKPVKGRLEPEKVFTHYLRYQGKKVHSLTGNNGLTILTETADRYNLEGYVPDISSTRLLHELSQSQRKKLDDLWAKVCAGFVSRGSCERGDSGSTPEV